MLDRLIDGAIATLLWGGVIIMGLLIAMAITSCTPMDPSQWKPIEHVSVQRSCRVACHPGQMLRYDSMDGSCTCMPRRNR